MAKNLAKAIQAGSVSSHELTNRVVSACLDAKGRDITVLHIADRSDVADYFIIASGRSDRQVQGVGKRILEEVAKYGIEPNSIEGFEKGHWLLIDFGDVVVHLFFEPMREHYDLENLWSEVERTDVKTDDERSAA